MLIFRYQLLHTRASKQKVSDTLNAVLPDFRKYTEIVRQLKDKTKERRELLAEKKATPVLHITKHRELSRQIATLTEDMEELRSEKNMLLNLFDKSDDAGMKEIRQWVDSMEASLQRLEQADSRYTSELDTAMTQYAELTKQQRTWIPLSWGMRELHCGRTRNRTPLTS
jgi:chromosome segregation ATPase